VTLSIWPLVYIKGSVTSITYEIGFVS